MRSRLTGLLLVGSAVLLELPAASTSSPGHAPETPGARIARCESLLVTQAEARADSARRFSLDLRGPEGSRLVYLGVRHSNDPADSQFVAIEKAWKDLRPTEALYEGTGETVGSSRDDAIRQGGEPGLIRFLARHSDVPARSLEPSRDEEIAELLRSFTAEQVALFYTTRSMMEQRDRRGLSGEALDEYVARYMDRLNKAPSLAGVLPDLAAYRAAYARWFPGQDPYAAPVAWFNPFYTSAETGSRFFNDVNRASSRFRDAHMYRLLSGARRPGARVFAEVGRDHVPAQAAALRCAWEP